MFTVRIEASVRLRLARKFALHLKPITPDEAERLKDEYCAKKLTKGGPQG